MRSRFLVLGLVLSFTFPVLAQAETSSVGDAGKAWEIPNDADRGQQIFTILDNSFGQSGSYLVKRTFKVGVDTEDPTCASLADPKAKPKPRNNTARGLKEKETQRDMTSIHFYA